MSMRFTIRRTASWMLLRLGTDFLAASSYKFFGPHTGCLYGKTEVLTDVAAYKIRPAPDDPPGKWETGTQSFESLAGITAAVDYIASLGEGNSRRERIGSAMETIGSYERAITERFLEGIAQLPRVRLYGRNTPTVAHRPSRSQSAARTRMKWQLPSETSASLCGLATTTPWR